MARTIPARPGQGKAISVEVAMASANTQYSYTFPASAREIMVTLKDSSVAFRVSFEAGEVASGDRYHNVAAGGSFSIDGPLKSNLLYFASSTATQVAVISYLYHNG